MADRVRELSSELSWLADRVDSDCCAGRLESARELLVRLHDAALALGAEIGAAKREVSAHG